MSDAPTQHGSESWRSRLSHWLRDSVHDLEQEVDAGWDRLTHRFGWSQPASLQVYTGYANGRRVRVGCRVLAGDPQGGPRDDDGWWDNLLNSYRRWNTHELAGVEVLCHFRGRTHRATSDEEGYVWMDLPDEPVEPPSTSGSGSGIGTRGEGPGGYWQEATFEIPAGQRMRGEPAPGPITAAVAVMCPTLGGEQGAAGFAILSDMDDTVLHTGVTNLLTMAKLTFLSNSQTRQPLVGVGSLYRALVAGGGTAAGGAEGAAATGDAAEDNVSAAATTTPINPIFYVSSSPWNLHDLLHDFLELNQIPVGPLRLRDLGVDSEKLIKSKGHRHKLVKARRIMDDFPDLPFVLFGDSGQADAELYAELVLERPEQVKAIFIRDVDPGDEGERDTAVLGHLNRAQAAGVPAMLVRHSAAAARRLVELGLLHEDAVDEVSREVERDQQRPTAAEAAVGL